MFPACPATPLSSIACTTSSRLVQVLTAIVGPMARNTESLGMKPTAYTVKTLNMFGGQFGAGNVYNKETGGLVGVIWKQKVAKGEPRLTAALNYVADDG